MCATAISPAHSLYTLLYLRKITLKTFQWLLFPIISHITCLGEEQGREREGEGGRTRRREMSEVKGEREGGRE